MTRPVALSGALLALACALASRPAHAEPQDPWWGRDKAKHFGVSAGLASGGYALAALVFERPHERALGGAAVALGAGAAKELWDLSGHGDPSWKDIAWDGLGTATGLGIALFLDLVVFGEEPSAARNSARLTVRF